MATLLFSINVGQTLEQITVATGPATTTDSIELNVDLATTLVNDGSGTRAIKKSEVIEALEKIMQSVYKNTTIPD